MLNLIVRVRHSNYISKNSMVSTTTATLLKRKSNGSLCDLICDPDLDIHQINLSSYEAGLYRIITRSHSYDIESGLCDDYDLALTPFTEGG
jgi:hypothetical protein